MSDAVEHETFVIHNADGSVSLDPWAQKTREQLKIRCGELSHALGNWQMIAMQCYEHGKCGLSKEDKAMVENLIEAYRDQP